MKKTVIQTSDEVIVQAQMFRLCYDTSIILIIISLLLSLSVSTWMSSSITEHLSASTVQHTNSSSTITLSFSLWFLCELVEFIFCPRSCSQPASTLCTSPDCPSDPLCACTHDPHQLSNTSAHVVCFQI